MTSPSVQVMMGCPFRAGRRPGNIILDSMTTGFGQGIQAVFDLLKCFDDFCNSLPGDVLKGTGLIDADPGSNQRSARFWIDTRRKCFDTLGRSHDFIDRTSGFIRTLTKFVGTSGKASLPVRLQFGILVPCSRHEGRELSSTDNRSPLLSLFSVFRRWMTRSR